MSAESPSPPSGFAEGEAAIEWRRLAVIALQPGLGIEGVEVGRSAVHEKDDDAFRFGGEVRRGRNVGVSGILPSLLHVDVCRATGASRRLRRSNPTDG